MDAASRHLDEQQIWLALAQVSDPEIPVISILDLGIVRKVEWDESREPAGFSVTVTPTYSGCPATEVIAESIREAVERLGFSHVSIKTQLSPAWTTDWLTDTGKEKLRQYGIAPPVGTAAEQVIDISRLKLGAMSLPTVHCPRCGSSDTQRLSQFGSTPCKSLYRCLACKEPFDYFKCH